LLSAETSIIIASAIGAFGTILAGLIGVWRSMDSMKKSNDDDHGRVQEKLDGLKTDVQEIKDDVKSLDTRIDDHFVWHMNPEGKPKL
jgi:hypothetical protein